MMRIQGLPAVSYWAGTYLYGTTFGCTFSVLAFLIGTIINLQGFNSRMILTLLLNAHSISCLSVFLSSLFTSVATGNSFAYLILFSGLAIPAFFSNPLPFSSSQMAMALVPPIGIAQSLLSIFSYRISQWATVYGLCLGGSIILLMMGIYLHEIRSTPHLVSQTPFFGLFQRKALAKVETMEKEHDEDIDRENQRVLEPVTTNEAIRLVQLRKDFGSKKVVNGINLRIDYGEAFGLLGPNGAGKTTTLSMMIGAIAPTAGRIMIDGRELSREIWKYVGVCPQFDTIWPDLTVQEHFIFYLRLRGVPWSKLKSRARRIASAVELDGDAFLTLASKLSGGMRRRLSIGITLSAEPRILIFDEPTTGLDPVTKRQIWKTLEKLKSDKQKSIVITTHSMEEADSLCNRIGIICGGKLRALGSQIHLKNRFGAGLKLSLVARLKSPTNELQRMKKIQDAFLQDMSQVIHEKLQKNAIIHVVPTPMIPSTEWNVTLVIVVETTEIFSKIQSFCREHNIQEWGFSQSTLEDVFINVVQSAKE
jgi:ABC-type multidrug transport system ATPase subunit